MLESREAMILEALNDLPKNFVLIGGYAINAYVPPRFSIDCDLFVFDKIPEIRTLLLKKGFEETEKGNVHYGKYLRFVRKTDKVSFDLLENCVLDRETGIGFEDSLFKQYSRQRFTVGRANPTRIKIRIADPELLFAMKFVSARRQDVRDIFMLSGTELNWNLINEIIREKCSSELIQKRVKSIKEKVTSAEYRDSLHVAFGRIPEKTFEKCSTNLRKILQSLTQPTIISKTSPISDP